MKRILNAGLLCDAMSHNKVGGGVNRVKKDKRCQVN